MRQADRVHATDAQLTVILNELSATTDVDAAKVIAKKFIETCAMQKTMPEKLRDLDAMTSHVKILKLCYSTMLAGEGLGVK